MKTTLRWGLGNRSVSGQHLHKFGMNQHAQRVVPRCDVRDRAAKWFATFELAIDLGDIPLDAVDTAVNVCTSELPRLADFPSEQKGQGVACNSKPG